MLSVLMSPNFCCDTQSIESEFAVKNTKDPSCFVSVVQTDGGCVRIVGYFSLHTLNQNFTPFLRNYVHCVNSFMASTTEHLRDVVEWEIHITEMQLTILEQLSCQYGPEC